jgi:hypothetical protein
MTAGEQNNIDLLSHIYREMDEMGKEKLRQVSKQLLNIWNTVNEEKPASAAKKGK